MFKIPGCGVFHQNRNNASYINVWLHYQMSLTQLKVISTSIRQQRSSFRLNVIMVISMVQICLFKYRVKSHTWSNMKRQSATGRRQDKKKYQTEAHPLYLSALF